MKRLIILVCFAMALPLLADEPVLKGVRTVYMNVRASRDPAVRKQLPDVRFVSRAEDADAVIELNYRSGGVLPATRTTMEVPVAGGNNTSQETRRVGVTIGEDTTFPAHMTGLVRLADGRTIVIHEGFAGDFFWGQFVTRFNKAWRAANP
jgi:hypothetical protein